MRFIRRAFVGKPANVGYVPTDIITNQTQLDTFLAQSAATLQGKVAGIVYNATPYTIARTQLRKNYGSGGLVLFGYGGTMPVFSQVSVENCTNLTIYGVEIYNGDGSTNPAIIYTQTNGITIDSCVIHAKYYDPNVDYASAGTYTNTACVISVSNGAGSITDLTIRNCTVYDGAYGLRTYAYNAGALNITGNTIYNCYHDHIQVGGTAGALTSTDVNWNVLYGTIGKSTDSLAPHSDMIQFLGSTLDWGGINILGNIFFNGLARGSGQGIFLDDMSTGKFYTANIKGNLVLINGTRSITVSSPKNCNLIGNTCGVADMSTATGANVYLAELEEGGGNVVKNTAARSYTLGTATASNNHTFSALTTGTFSALFDGAAFEDSDLDTRTKVLAAYAMKVGGALDSAVNIGAVGSGYVDYTARTLNGAME